MFRWQLMIHKFANIQLDTNRELLFRDNEEIELSSTSFKTLLILIEHKGETVKNEDILAFAWDGKFVEGNSVHKAVSELRRVFGDTESPRKFIETKARKGYRFVHDVISGSNILADGSGALEPTEINLLGENKPTFGKSFNSKRLIFTLAFICMASIAAFFLFHIYKSYLERKEIERVIEQSQLYESLVLYKSPKLFSENNLDNFWTKELDSGSKFDRTRIRESVERLRANGLSYGDGTFCELFEFKSVEVDHDIAISKTLEKWSLAIYKDDGSMQSNKIVGPYFVSYLLRKLDNRWQVEKSATARADRSASDSLTPIITSVRVVGNLKSKQFLRIDGSNFVAQTVYLKITGSSCPEASPCFVKNELLGQHALISDDWLDHIPVNLETGDYVLTAYNGESNPSKNAIFTIP